MYPLISVLWTDSGMHVNHGWDTLEKYKENVNSGSTRVQTVGFLMCEDDEMIMIGLSHDAFHDTWFGAQMILKCNIIERKQVNFDAAA